MNEKVLQAVIKLKDQISQPLNNVNRALKSVKIGANSVGKEIKSNEAALNRYKTSLSKAESNLKGVKAQMEYTANKIKALEKAIENGEDETGQLANRLKETKKSMSDLKSEASSLKSKIDNYKNSIKQTENNIEGLKNKQGAFSKSLKNMAGKVKDVSDKMVDLGKKTTASGVAIVGSLTGITASYVEQGAEINKISKMAGMSTKSYQQWDKMLKSTGYSMEQANGDFAAMAERMAETRDQIKEGSKSQSDLTQVVKKLGLSVTDGNGKLKDTGTFMNELMNATSKLSNKTEQQALMTALLSTTGEELLPHLDNWSQKAKELEGYSYIDEKQLEKIQNFKNKWNDLKGQFDLLKGAIGEALLPSLENLLSKITPIVEKITTWVQENPKAIQTLMILGATIAGLGVVLTTLGVVLGVVAAGMTIVSIVSAPVTLTIAAITLGVMALVAAAIYLWLNWNQVWSWIKSKVSTTVEAIKQTFSTIKGSISNVIENVKDTFGQGIDWIKEKWEGLKSFFTNNPITAAVKSVSNFITGGDGQRSAWGTKRVVGNDVPYRLHDGERVLTRAEADRYDRGQNAQGVNITINGLTVREEADINKIANTMVRKLKEASLGYSSIGGMA